MRRIKLTQGKHALIDDCDYPIVSQYKWHAHKTPDGPNQIWYAKTNILINGKRITVRLHQLLTGFKLVDHKNRNGLDNQRKNFRTCTPTQNQWNRAKRSGCKNRFKGITKSSNPKKWCAQITRNGKPIYLGSFNSAIEAARAYDKASKRFFGSFAVTNETLGLL